MTTVHKNLTGADLHEPKGADTALSGQVYVANGAGSGVWTAASSVITNTAWVTGNVRLTLDSVAQSGWILGTNGSIGDGSSSATIRANSDTSALFTLLWNNYDNTKCPVSGGRGVSAAADFAAHKTLTLPDMWQRAIGIAGNYNITGQTTRALGDTVGAETVTLIASQLPANIPNSAVTTLSPVAPIVGNNTNGSNITAGGTNIPITTSTLTAATTVTINPGGGGSHSNMQPTVFINIEIKL